jgi:hypothetical protein
MAAARLSCHLFFLNHPDLQLHFDDFERTDVPGGGVQACPIHCREPARRRIENMRSTAAEFGQKGMGGCGELEPNRDQRTVNFDADIAGKFKHQASRIALYIRAAAYPCSTIGNEPAEPGYDHRLVFGQERGQVENIIILGIGHRGFGCTGNPGGSFEYTSLDILIGLIKVIFNRGTGTTVRHSGHPSSVPG